MLAAEIATSLTATIARARAALPVKSIREQFGETLLALGHERDDFVALTADLMYATGSERFGHAFPDRMINFGVAEQNLTAVAAGLALCGKLPVVCGYAAFTSLRAIEQAKVDCAYNAVKVILVGQSAGLSYGVGGPTHQTYEDVAIMRAIPNTTVLVPSDAVSVDRALRASLDYPFTGPIYLRLGRGPELLINDPDAPFAIGRTDVRREGSDLSFFANGCMVAEALLAAEALSEAGIDARVVEVATVKPLDAAAVRAAASGVRAIIVAEEHSVLGGLGGAVLEALDATIPAPVVRVGIQDRYPPIGPPHALRAALGLDAEALVANALGILGPA